MAMFCYPSPKQEYRNNASTQPPNGNGTTQRNDRAWRDLDRAKAGQPEQNQKISENGNEDGISKHLPGFWPTKISDVESKLDQEYSYQQGGISAVHLPQIDTLGERNWSSGKHLIYQLLN
jgi:hypothetical protein